MKVLFGIQGTGNGHLSRASYMIPYLQSQCDLDILVSGTESDIRFPYPIKYTYRGFSFGYNARGGISYKSTWNNFSGHLLREVKHLPVEEYDLVINDFEPISAWAARFRKVPCIALGHQASFLSPYVPRPRKRDFLGEKVLKHYAPADQYIGLHFESYDEFIYPPIIRTDIREATPTNEGHYTVYLPALGAENLLKLLKQFPQITWHAFMKNFNESIREDNVWLRPVDSKTFFKSLLSCEGVFTGAGFETPAETLFLGKKLLAVPIKGQYEQMCNAAALKRMDVPVITNLKNPAVPSIIQEWINQPQPDRVLFEDCTKSVIDKALAWGLTQQKKSHSTSTSPYSRVSQMALPVNP